MKYLVIAKRPIVQVVEANTVVTAKLRAIANPDGWQPMHKTDSDDLDDWEISATPIPGTENE